MRPHPEANVGPKGNLDDLTHDGGVLIPIDRPSDAHRIAHDSRSRLQVNGSTNRGHVTGHLTTDNHRASDGHCIAQDLSPNLDAAADDHHVVRNLVLLHRDAAADRDLGVLLVGVPESFYFALDLFIKILEVGFHLRHGLLDFVGNIESNPIKER